MRNYLQNLDKAPSQFISDSQRKKLFAYIYSRISDKEIANDLTQDTLLKAYIKVSENSYQDQGNFAAWMLSIAKNIINDHYRKEYRQLERYKTSKNRISEELGYIYDCPYDIEIPEENDPYLRLMRKAVKNAFLKLPKKQRLVIHLKIYKHLSFKKIAKRQQIKINTSIARYHYGIKRLADNFSQKEKDMYSELLEDI